MSVKITEVITVSEDWMSGETRDRNVEVTLIDDDKRVESVSIGEGEPEDAVLFRDLNDAYSIFDLVKKAYEYGKQGVEIEFTRETEEDD